MIPSNTNNNNVVRTERARNVRDYRFVAPAHTEKVFSTLELATCKIVEALAPSSMAYTGASKFKASVDTRGINASTSNIFPSHQWSISYTRKYDNSPLIGYSLNQRRQ